MGGWIINIGTDPRHSWGNKQGFHYVASPATLTVVKVASGMVLFQCAGKPQAYLNFRGLMQRTCTPFYPSSIHLCLYIIKSNTLGHTHLDHTNQTCLWRTGFFSVHKEKQASKIIFLLIAGVSNNTAAEEYLIMLF